MTLEILPVPGCPGADLLAARLETLFAGLPGFRLSRRIVTSQADADRLGMTGSPTLLADAADPFPPSDGQPRPCRAGSTQVARTAMPPRSPGSVPPWDCEGGQPGSAARPGTRAQ